MAKQTRKQSGNKQSASKQSGTKHSPGQRGIGQPPVQGRGRGAERTTARPPVAPEVQQRLREVATELRQLLYGENGFPEWGTLFRQIEADGMSVGLELARLLMEQTTGDQAEHMPPQALAVPDDAVQPAGTQDTTLLTPAGEVTWEQPCGYLQRGRRAFFPSEAGLGAAR